MQNQPKIEELVKQAAMQVMQVIRDEPIESIFVRREGEMGLPGRTEFWAFDENSFMVDVSRNEKLESALEVYTRLREQTVQALYHDCGGLLRTTLTRGVTADGKISISDHTTFDQHKLQPDFVRKLKSTTPEQLQEELAQCVGDNEFAENFVNSVKGIKSGTALKIEVSDSKIEGRYRFLTDDHGHIDPDERDQTFEMFQALASRAFPGYDNKDSDHDGGVVTLTVRRPQEGEVQMEFAQWNLDKALGMRRESRATYEYSAPASTLEQRKAPYFPL